LHRQAHTREFLRISGEAETQYWVDPTSPQVNGDRLGLALHTWVGEDDSTLRLA